MEEGEKKFSEYTHKIGWVDPKSELFLNGVRPGDEIVKYNDQPFQNSKDHLIAPTLSKGKIKVEGYHVDAQSKAKTPFSYTVSTYTPAIAKNKEIVTSGILESANYVKYLPLLNHTGPISLEHSPMKNTGIQPGDRIVWIDGVPIYSALQLAHVLNDSKTLLTIKRGEDVLLRRVPRVMVEDIKLDPEFKEELVDWQFEAGLNALKIQKLYVIPYTLNNTGIVEGSMKFIDKDKNEEFAPKTTGLSLYSPLEIGDKILAVDGVPVAYSFEKNHFSSSKKTCQSCH